MINHNNKRNPILPINIHVPDSEAHVMPDGKLYLYGSFDNRDDVYCSDKYHVVSTPDMENWTIHDIAFKGQDVPWFNNPDAPKYPGIDLSNPTPFIKKMMEDVETDETDMKEKPKQQNKEEKPPLLFAPDGIHKDGKYYLYFCMIDDSEGVAVSDRPEGPFKDPIQLPVGGIDPAVFIDDDGQAYYYWGQLFSHGVKLNNDMISFDEKEIVHNLVTEEKHYFHEGASMRKSGDTYYLVYSNMERGKPTSLGYSTSKHPLGPFTYKGIIVDNDGCDPKSWNNHGSIEEFNGQWYVFYHRSSRATQQYRRLCIEPININDDGTIDEVVMTSQGIGNPFGSGEIIHGYEACQMSGSAYIGPEGDDDKEECIRNISDGDSATFRYVESDKGFDEIEIIAEGKAVVEVLLDNQFVGSVIIDGDNKTKGLINNVSSGRKELKLRFKNPEELKIYAATLN